MENKVKSLEELKEAMNKKDTNNSRNENYINNGKKDKEEKFFSCDKCMYMCKKKIKHS